MRNIKKRERKQTRENSFSPVYSFSHTKHLCSFSPICLVCSYTSRLCERCTRFYNFSIPHPYHLLNFIHKFACLKNINEEELRKISFEKYYTYCMISRSFLHIFSFYCSEFLFSLSGSWDVGHVHKYIKEIGNTSNIICFTCVYVSLR